MHEMQTIVADVLGVCPSVCLLRGSTRLHCAKTDQNVVCGEILRAQETPRLSGILIPHTKAGAGEIFANCRPPHISGKTKGRDLTFCEHIEGWGPKNCAKVGHREVGVGLRELFLNIGPLVSPERLNLETRNFACR